MAPGLAFLSLRLFFLSSCALPCRGAGAGWAEASAPGRTTAPQGGADLRGWSDRGWQRGSWAVRPRVILSGGRSVLLEEAELGREGFPLRLRLALELEGEHLELDLEQNRKALLDLSDGTRIDTPLAGAEGRCCYQGAIQGYLGSWANVCLCSGLRGLLVVSQGRRYSIEWAEEEEEEGALATRLEAVKLGGPSLNPEPGRTLLRRTKREAEAEGGTVELVMVADRAEYNLNGGDMNRTRLRMVEIANYMDGFFRVLGLRVSLVGLEVWSGGDPISVDGPPQEVLRRFLRWRQSQLLPKTPHDSAQLLLGSPFTGGAFGASAQGSICSPASGGVSRDHSVSPLVMASTVSHQLGHSLGFGHDDDGPRCGCDGSSPNLPPGRSCIMEAPKGVMPGLTFSRCSLLQAQGILGSSRAWCLRDAPDPARTERSRCGNGLLEGKEECDCGLRLECQDPCCNASACRLMPGAQCATGGACCHQCKLREAGFRCRPLRGECDLPEFCDGASPRCPRNAHKADGTPCEAGTALCRAGACPSLLRQCQDRWGAGAVPASGPCLAALNGRGDAQGHCGQQDNGSYVPCGERDAQCGRLQCRDGSSAAEGAEGSPSCPHLRSAPLDDALDLALVQSGTPCGLGKVCVEQRCLDLSSSSSPSSSVEPPPSCRCNGRGVCNNYGRCHCKPGWAPPDCKQGGNGGSLDSGPPAQEKAGPGAVPVALLLTALLLLLALGLCFARRAGIHKRLCRIGKGSTYRYRIAQPGPRSDSQGPPERPRPPALQATPSSQQPLGASRPDPPSKPLPPDPTPKGQQASSSSSEVVREQWPPPPTRPLPADPLPKEVTQPPPRKALPPDPLRTQLRPCEGRDPQAQALLLPSRPAPPPPPPPSPSVHFFPA